MPTEVRTSPHAQRPWADAFSFEHVKVLIVCRGPIRLEAIDVFDRLGMQPCGILLSERDSVVYPRALAPELRRIGRNERVHRIPDYVAGANEDKTAHIGRILELAKREGYTHLFAGYGFMAEDADFIRAIELAGLGFIGPSAGVVRQAGNKDAAKTVARRVGVSVTPGLDNVVARTLLRQAGERDGTAFLQELAQSHGLAVADGAGDPEVYAERVLEAAQAAGVELVTVEALQQETERQVAALLEEHPGRRLRLKHIGGGGGKGQRIVSGPEEAADAVLEVLTESRAMGPGANRNFLIELNVETTRHNEIQLLGNGEWCVALGGRDCSLQMHEQKLLEVSISDEMLADAADAYGARGLAAPAEVLGADRAVLAEMEAQAARFGEAVGLDSASTFESIVEGEQHFFMEMNTRIQVEHRVTELVYSLRFQYGSGDTPVVEVDSLVEAMAWVAVHGRDLPRPERVPRHRSAAEVRINATNDALRPHAGGVIWGWTPPRPGELRDDQGIGIGNPDTGGFMPYQVAGAYDSNVALVVAHGGDRRETFANLAEILRRMVITGQDVSTNRAFHYGLLHWMLAVEPMVKPTTRFVQHYLTAVGLLAREVRKLDPDVAWEALLERHDTDAQRVLAPKATLLLRPLRALMAEPHLLAGWCAPHEADGWRVRGDTLAWRTNPLVLLERLYRYLHLEPRPGASPEERIWEDDLATLNAGLAFYRELAGWLPEDDWATLDARLAEPEPPPGMAAEQWAHVQAAHRGHQLGLELLKLPLLCARDSGFSGMRVDKRLDVTMPGPFTEHEAGQEAVLALAPPPPVDSNQIVAWTGGTFYARPSPDHEPYVYEGMHVEVGDTVGLLEVMKMFNPVRAPFAGTVTRTLVNAEAGALVHKGQALYELEPDHPLEAADEDAGAQRREATRALMQRL